MSQIFLFYLLAAGDLRQTIIKLRFLAPKLPKRPIRGRGRTYPFHIQAQKKDSISYHYHGKQKGYGYIYPISFVKNIASIVTVSEQLKARPGSTAAHKPSTFYPIKLKP
jgi:hypothetical protein